MKQKFEQFLLFIKSIDKGFYFPIFVIFTCPFIIYFFDWINAYLFFLIISFLHFLFLRVKPYSKESNFYFYQCLKTDFYRHNSKHKHLFNNTIIQLSQFFLLFSFYCSFVFPEYLMIFFPLVFMALPIMISSVTIDIINIVNRPRLPQSIFKYHPILQRRYSPVVDIIINKAIPLCLNVGKGLLQGYGVFAIGWKTFHGPLEIDPVRNSLCNYYYKFPQNHLWTETSLSSWTIFKRTAAAKSIPYDEAVRKFIQGENLFSQRVENAATVLIRRRTN
jgi:hypothetical protein